MSLFPSASFKKVGKPKSDNSREWLENKSFASEAAEVLRKEQQKVSKDTSKSFDKTVNHSFPSTNQHTLTQFEELLSAHSSDDDDVNRNSEDDFDKNGSVAEPTNKMLVLEVDKKPDKNNLYFNKPYKVAIPKYHRNSFACIGLPPYLEIVFEKKRKRKIRHASDRYFQIDTESLNENYEVSGTDVFKLQIEELNIETRENQSNIDAWMRLISLQDELPGKNVKLKTEKKISIIDKAIAANPRNHLLKLKRLEMLEAISEDTDRDWKNLVFQHPDVVETWEAYIRHTLTNARFTVQRTLKVYEKCLETFSAIRKQAHRSADEVRSIEAKMMSMFTKLVQFLTESGHTERTVVILLLMLEINVRCPSCKDITDVKHFYESRVPLLGQPDSKGWNSWYQKFDRGGWVDTGTGISDMDAEDDVDDEIDFDKSVNQNWLNIESKRGRSNLLPWRSTEDCEDLGRKVDYDDVKGFLFLINEDHNRVQLLHVFMQVFGTVAENALTSSKVLLSQPCLLTHAFYCNDVLGNVSALQSITCSGCRHHGILPRSPHHELFHSIFEQLATSCPPSIRMQVGSCAIGYYVVRISNLCSKDDKSELKKTYKEARKLTKSFLKNDPNDFVMWSKLAKVEYLAKNSEECKKITHNALCMCKAQEGALVLCRTYAELECETNRDSVKQVLSAFADNRDFVGYLQKNKIVTAAVVLRATRSMERLCEDLGCVYQQVELNCTLEPSSFANAFCCYVIYGHVTSSPVPRDVFRKCLQIFRKAKTNGSEQAVYDLRLIHELNIRFTSPEYRRNNIYRNTVLSALDDLPNHPLFLLKLCQIEIGSSLTSVARRLFSSTSSPVILFFSVYFELLRMQRSSEEAMVPPRVLNILERALASQHSDNILAWRMLAKLSKKTDSVLTRATAHCPWSKALACDRIRLETEPIESVVTFMQDKGLRVRTPVEEVRLLLAI